MLNQTAQSIVAGQLRQIPVKTYVVVPFVALTELAAHEEQLFAGMTVHPCQKHPEIGKLLPFVAGHLRQQRTLAVNDFVVAKDQNEVLLERVEQRKGDIPVIIAPVNRIEAHVLEEVVHPTHVPFETEPEPAQ